MTRPKTFVHFTAISVNPLSWTENFTKYIRTDIIYITINVIHYVRMRKYNRKYKEISKQLYYVPILAISKVQKPFTLRSFHSLGKRLHEYHDQAFNLSPLAMDVKKKTNF